VKIEVHLDDDLIARKAAAIMAVDARGAGGATAGT
jgi:hypothetical protein